MGGEISFLTRATKAAFSNLVLSMSFGQFPPVPASDWTVLKDDGRELQSSSIWRATKQWDAPLCFTAPPTPLSTKSKITGQEQKKQEQGDSSPLPLETNGKWLIFTNLLGATYFCHSLGKVRHPFPPPTLPLFAALHSDSFSIIVMCGERGF